MVEDFAKHHYETSGGVRGTAVLQGRTYEIDGMCHRDHSWGVRRWDSVLLSHRWVSGTIGPELSFGSMAWHAVDNSVVKIGYVVRDGELTLATGIDVVTHLELDGITHRGGEITWTLADGSSLHAVCTVVDGVVTGNHGVVWIDSMMSEVMGPTFAVRGLASRSAASSRGSKLRARAKPISRVTGPSVWRSTVSKRMRSSFGFMCSLPIQEDWR